MTEHWKQRIANLPRFSTQLQARRPVSTPRSTQRHQVCQAGNRGRKNCRELQMGRGVSPAEDFPTTGRDGARTAGR